MLVEIEFHSFPAFIAFFYGFSFYVYVSGEYGRLHDIHSGGYRAHLLELALESSLRKEDFRDDLVLFRVWQIKGRELFTAMDSTEEQPNLSRGIRVGRSEDAAHTRGWTNVHKTWNQVNVTVEGRDDPT